jgi:ABC-type lipoprotein export system ATPase subunit
MIFRWLRGERLAGPTPPTRDLALEPPASPAPAAPPAAEAQLIELRRVDKTYVSPAGSFTALKSVDLRVQAGEFVSIIGKSGSGKSTLLNLITGIDRPTAGEVLVGGVPVHALSEGQIAQWRGRNVGVIFQFFQLLPTLTLAENVMLPMDFCGLYAAGERRQRALALLDLVGMADQADKIPSSVSGGQQQRVAIARALANDPPILAADEPTGSLDSKTAASIVELFEDLVDRGRTIVLVTHDTDLAQRASRTVVVADGEVINQHVATALATLDLDRLAAASARLAAARYPAGAAVIRQGEPAEAFYIITGGEAEVVLEHPGGQEIVVSRLRPGQYFGEIALLRGGRRTATVRAARGGELEVMALGREAFRELTADSSLTRETIEAAIEGRLSELAARERREPLDLRGETAR